MVNVVIATPPNIAQVSPSAVDRRPILLGQDPEADIANHHQAEDDANAMLDSAKFARRVRRRLGFSQVEFAERIDVSLDTICNWEQGKRCPTA
jgi:putative transcriptional regulator